MNGPGQSPHQPLPPAQEGPPVHRQVEHVMGMPVSLALRGRHADSPRGRSAWADAMHTLREIDRTFSTYRADSCINRFARGELRLGECAPEVAEVFDLAERARVESDGAFDINRPGPDGRQTLDPSGVLKGWAVDRAAHAFEGLPETDFCLSAGGDMVCRVVIPENPSWQIGIEDPHRWDRVVAVVPVRAGAVATSGLGRRGGHIVDARTGTVPAGIASVTVVADSLTRADIDATAAFALGAECEAWLARRTGAHAVVVRDDGSATVIGGSPDTARATQGPHRKRRAATQGGCRHSLS